MTKHCSAMRASDFSPAFNFVVSYLFPSATIRAKNEICFVHKFNSLFVVKQCFRRDGTILYEVVPILLIFL